MTPEVSLWTGDEAAGGAGGEGGQKPTCSVGDAAIRETTHAVRGELGHALHGRSRACGTGERAIVPGSAPKAGTDE